LSQGRAKHLWISAGEVAEDVVVCGDPARAQKIASFLEAGRLVQQNREYHSWDGSFGGRRIGVVSHGIGGAGAAVCFNELADCGVKRIIRVGTAGALQDNVAMGDAVLASAAIRLDGTSQLMIPAEYPAVADLELLVRLRESSRAELARTHVGIVLTSAIFYSSLLPDNLSLYARAGALAVEMETATLFIVGALRGIATASVLAIDGNPLRWHEGVYGPTRDDVAKAVDGSIKAALGALARPSS
jgi:uridine phosphorylase